MLELPITRFVSCTGALSQFHQSIVIANGTPLILDKVAYDHLRDAAVGFKECCECLGLAVTQSFADELIIYFEEVLAGDQEKRRFDTDLCKKISAQINFAIQTLQREAKTKVAMVLTPDQIALFAPSVPLWGPDVRSKFPSITKDIDEGAKCLALGLPTAAVFHCMRVMEVALKAVCHCLNGPVNGKNWGDFLTSIRNVKAAKGGQWPEKDYFQEIYSRLDAVKDAWRNSTMHVERTYDENDAAQIFSYTKAFMEKIASRMDETGLPLA